MHLWFLIMRYMQIIKESLNSKSIKSFHSYFRNIKYRKISSFCLRKFNNTIFFEWFKYNLIFTFSWIQFFMIYSISANRRNTFSYNIYHVLFNSWEIYSLVLNAICSLSFIHTWLVISIVYSCIFSNIRRFWIARKCS